MDKEFVTPIYIRIANKAYYERLKLTEKGKILLQEHNERNKARNKLARLRIKNEQLENLEFVRLSTIIV